MIAFINGRRGTAFVAVLLIVQIGLFLLSMDAGAFAKISAFCTGPASSNLGLLFGLLHLLFLALLMVGLISLQVVRLRALYVGILALAMLTLPFQAVLVANEQLTCDGP